MKSIFLFLLLSCSVLVSSAQDKQYQGHLWKVSGNGLSQPSFLYGTMHVSSKVAFHLSDSFYKAIESVDVVALEINPETWMDAMTSDTYVADQMGNAFSMRSDYNDVGFYKAIFELPQPENSMIGEALGQQLGILNSLLYRTNNFNAEFEEDTYLDLFIYQAGRKQGKEITGLENLGLTMRLNEQAAQPITNKDERLRIKEENERRRHELKKILDDKGFGEVMEDAYRRGDLDLLDTISRLATVDDRYHDLIIVYRNEEMAKAMDSIMQTKSLFAGVGAAHLPNTYGMINLLREKGYTVTAVERTKTDFGRTTKERLENTFITHPFEKRISFDGSFSTDMPGPLYEFPEANNVQMAAFPDMANGATYVVTRIMTYAPLHGMTQQQYMKKIDSVLFENIPGKIIQKKRDQVDGYPCFRITNKTKKGDIQRYTIVVTPIELIIYKIGGKKEYVKQPEVNAFSSELKFDNMHGGEWTTFAPKNAAYTAELPGNLTVESDNNAFTRGYWKKNVQSFDPKDSSYFGVMNRSYSDMKFMEEDTFELRQMAQYFIGQFDYKIVEQNFSTFLGRNSIDLVAQKAGYQKLYVRLFIKSEQYYLLFAQCNDEQKVARFLSSFSLTDFSYDRPFELQEDSSLFYSVISPVEKTKRNNYYGYYAANDEDDSYQEELLDASYYNKETDESIFVKYKRFHKYAYEVHQDSIWDEVLETLTQEGALAVRKERKWSVANRHFYEVEVTDTNSSRNILARYYLLDGHMYSLKTEIEKELEPSRFVKAFYSSFTPRDTLIGFPVLKNKTANFLQDLASDDSITHEAAYNSLNKIRYDDEDAILLMNAIEASYKAEHDVAIRAGLLSELGNLTHPATFTFFKEKFKQVGDTIAFQIPILAGISKHKSKKSTKLFLKLLKEETPLSNENYIVNKMFYPFADSLQLIKYLYPGFFKLAALPEYNYKVYWYLSRALDSGYLTKRVYRRKVKRIAWEANNEAKRQKSTEAGRSADYWENARRYERYRYDYSLYNYAVLLAPFKKRNAKVRNYFKRLDQLKSPGLLIDISIFKVKNGDEVADSIWYRLAQNDNDRIKLYYQLKEEGLLHLFPSEFSSQKLLSQSLYADLNNLNASKDSVTYVDRILTEIDGDSGYVYFFKSKGRYNDKWNMGYLALMVADTNSFTTEVELFDDNMSYTKFEDLNLQMEMQVRKLQMKARQRYRVSDEEQFKALKSGRSYY